MKLSEIRHHKIPPGACFKAPEGYFEQLTQQMMQRIECEAAPSPARPKPAEGTLYLRQRRWCAGIAAAACLAFVLLLDRAVENIDRHPQQTPAAGSEWAATGEDITYYRLRFGIARTSSALLSPCTVIAEADEIYDYLMLDENKLCDYAEYEE